MVLVSLLEVAGLFQVVLCCAGMVIVPKMFDWRGQLERSGDSQQLRQLFYACAGYVWGMSLIIGLLSALAPGSLVEKACLPAVVVGFICAHWSAGLAMYCLLIGLKSERKPHRVLGYFGVWLLCVCLLLVYAATLGHNLNLITSTESTPRLQPASAPMIMLVSVVLLLAAAKIFVLLLFSVRRGPDDKKLSWQGVVVFFFLWPGMHPESFINEPEELPGKEWNEDMVFGTMLLVLGALGCTISRGWCRASSALRILGRAC